MMENGTASAVSLIRNTKSKRVEEMNNILDIAIDIETLSRKPTAAILAIAACPFRLDGYGEQIDTEPFFRVIDASSCAMYDMDFSKGTVKWWSEQSSEAKAPFLEGKSVPIKSALFDLNQIFEQWRSDQKAEGLRVWMQGTDFDGPILRNAFITVFDDDRTTGENESMPWRHDELRDSRTFILEHMRLFHPEAEDPYSVIPEMKGLVWHNACNDIKRLIHNVQFCEKEKIEFIQTIKL